MRASPLFRNKSIIQRLKPLLDKDFMNTKLTVYHQLPSERGSKFKGVFIFKLSANLRDLSVLEDPLELNSLYARDSSHTDHYILGGTDVGLLADDAK